MINTSVFVVTNRERRHRNLFIGNSVAGAKASGFVTCVKMNILFVLAPQKSAGALRCASMNPEYTPSQ
jgi:hypothetical protein